MIVSLIRRRQTRAVARLVVQPAAADPGPAPEPVSDSEPETPPAPDLEDDESPYRLDE
jgi:hypothetical protein